MKPTGASESLWSAADEAARGRGAASPPRPRAGPVAAGEMRLRPPSSRGGPDRRSPGPREGCRFLRGPAAAAAPTAVRWEGRCSHPFSAPPSWRASLEGSGGGSPQGRAGTGTRAPRPARRSRLPRGAAAAGGGAVQLLSFLCLRALHSAGLGPACRPGAGPVLGRGLGLPRGSAVLLSGTTLRLLLRFPRAPTSPWFYVFLEFILQLWPCRGLSPCQEALGRLILQVGLSYCSWKQNKINKGRRYDLEYWLKLES